jgi:hypothetical protein
MAFGAGELVWGFIIKQFEGKYFAIWQLDEP